ncbi:glycosyltransferase [Moorena producens JHB]|uniref:Glycosyltransferase n=1 Tax=Moorena producens (strain JHB) TaxID=1454205 RepID=A0A1D9G8I2_MOOP1|nr:glycosyltransferase [Moorena producens]AOY83932.1 glycosyltransferase [Moorena producens JHB]
MKIWHITKTIYGGSGQYALRLSKALNDLGHQSVVYVIKGDTPLGISKLSLASNSAQQFANRCLVSVLRRLSKGPYHSGFRLERWTYGDNPIKPPDVVHLHGMTGWIGFHSLRALIPPNTPVFWTAHDLWILSGGCVVYQGCNGYQSGCYTCPILKAPASSWSQQEWKHKAKFIQDYQVIPIANSQWVADKIRRSPFFGYIKDKEIPVIPPIVDSVFFEAASFYSLREELKISPHRIVLGLSARALTDTYKGIPEFLQRFAREDDLVDKCTLLLCGDGQIDVPNNLDCRFLGALTETKELARFYSACDVFVSPSRMETFGMTLLEAQAAGTPVVAFRVGGTPEAVCHLKHGYLAELGNDSDLISGLRWLLSIHSKNSEMGIASSRWVGSKFLDTIVGSHQIASYTELCNSPLRI